MSYTTKLISAIATNDKVAAKTVFEKIVKEKVQTALDIKRVALTSKIYSKTEK